MAGQPGARRMEAVARLIEVLRRLPAQGRATKALLGSSAALGALVLVLRYILSRRSVVPGLITDPGRVGRRVKGRGEEYDPEEYDVVIIGGGTAGCVLASRLSEDPRIRVLLLEAGKSSRHATFSQIPAAYHQFFHTRYDYNLYTVPQKHAASKRKYWPRGKVLGGCSSVNAMIFHHGAPTDYDEWAQLQKGQDGSEGWSYNQLSPYFLKFEKFHPSKDYSLVDVSLRGSAGPVHIGYFGATSGITKKFLEACDHAGLANNPDLNTPKGSLGSSKAMTFIDSRGRRVTTESAYLTPEVLARPNLKVATKARVTRILFDQHTSASGAAPRAVGVQFSNAQDEIFEVKARKEVIVSAGAIHTPQILMLSGVGPAEHLASHTIPVVADLPGVGSHLMDHPVVDFHFKDKSRAVESSVSYDNPKYHPTVWNVMRLVKSLMQFYFTGKGLMTTNVAEAAAFVRSTDPKMFPPEKFPPQHAPTDTSSGPDAPDIELFCTPMAYIEHGEHSFLPGHHFGLHAVLLRPTSKGTVRLQSADPFEPPIIDPEYLATDHDIAVLVRATRLISRVAHTDPLASLLDPAGDGNTFLNHGLDTLSDGEIAALIRERVETLYHPACTARMAAREDGGVVDPHLRVHGISNLRVVDASIFTTITSGHTVSPTIAVAEKAADLVREAIKLSY